MLVGALYRSQHNNRIGLEQTSKLPPSAAVSEISVTIRFQCDTTIGLCARITCQHRSFNPFQLYPLPALFGGIVAVHYLHSPPPPPRAPTTIRPSFTSIERTTVAVSYHAHHLLPPPLGKLHYALMGRRGGRLCRWVYDFSLPSNPPSH